MYPISVIIPCYNAERRLKRLLRSLHAQTMQDFEVICINDGSTDNTLAVLHSCMSMFDEMRIISLPANGGSYNARVTGINQAQGEYIYMPDTDDYMHPQALQQMYEHARTTSADIVCMGAYVRNGIVPRDMRLFTPPAVDVMNRRQMIGAIFTDTDVNVQMWNKLYRRSLFEGVTHCAEHLFFGDDTLLHLHACSRAERMTFVPYMGYSYYLGGGSCRWQSHRWHDNIILFGKMIDRLQGISLSEQDRDILAMRYAEIFCMSYMIGIAQRMFLRPFSNKAMRQRIASDMGLPIWDRIRELLADSDNTLAKAVVGADADADAIITAAAQRNRSNFKNELISYLSTWRLPW